MEHPKSNGYPKLKSSFIQRKQQLTTRLKRLILGASTSIGAICKPCGELATTPEGIANALEHHWQSVFQERGNNGDLLDHWLQTAPNFRNAPNNAPSASASSGDKSSVDSPRLAHVRPPLPVSDESWRIQREDIVQSIKLAGSSAPGPDSLPYMVWKISGDSQARCFTTL